MKQVYSIAINIQGSVGPKKRAGAPSTHLCITTLWVHVYTFVIGVLGKFEIVSHPFICH